VRWLKRNADYGASDMDLKAARKGDSYQFEMLVLAVLTAVGTFAGLSRPDDREDTKSEGALIMRCHLVESSMSPVLDVFRKVRFGNRNFPEDEVATWEIEVLSQRRAPILPDSFFDPALAIVGGRVVHVEKEMGVHPSILVRPTSSGLAFGEEVINYGDRLALKVYVHASGTTTAWRLVGKFAGVRVDGSCVEDMPKALRQEGEGVRADRVTIDTGALIEAVSRETEIAIDTVCSARVDDTFDSRLAGWQMAGGRIDLSFLLALLRSAEPRSVSIFFSTDSPAIESANFWRVKELELQRNIARIAGTGGVVTVLSGTRLAGRGNHPARENQRRASQVASFLRNVLGEQNTHGIRLEHIAVLPSLTLSRSDLRLAGVNVDDERVAGQAAGELVSVVFEGC